MTYFRQVLMTYFRQVLDRIINPGPVSLRSKHGGWVSLVGVGLSAFEANYSNNQRKNAQDASNSAQSTANALEQQQLQEGGDLYNRYKTEFQPAQDRLVAAAEKPVDPNQEAGLAVAGVQQAADVQKGIAERNLARYGISPTSGAWLNMEKQGTLDTAAASAAAGTNARRYAQAETLRRLGLVANMGNDMLSMSMGLQRGGVNYYSNQAGQDGNVAGGYGMGVGNGITNSMYWLNKYNSKPGTTTPTTTAGGGT